MPLVPSYIKQLSSYKPGANIDDIKIEKLKHALPHFSCIFRP
jgi:hypothetical protein